MHIEGMDELDNKILSVIHKDARLSYSEIGVRVGVSRVAVKNRMSALEENGIIAGYYTKINLNNAPGGRLFFVDVITEPDEFNAIADIFAQSSVIRKVYAVTGECRFRAEGFASSNNTYEQFMKYIKSNLNGVKSITIQDALYAIKDEAVDD